MAYSSGVADGDRTKDLDTDRIGAAALAVADEHGAPGCTMRAVADALGVTPMALYHHVDDKESLVALLVDRVIAERPLPASTGVWRDDLFAMAQWMRRITHAHPAVSHLRRRHQVWTPAIFPMTERWLNIWQLSGLRLDRAVTAAATSSLAIAGAVDQELLLDEMSVPDDSMLAALPNARLIVQRERDRDADFELVVRSLVEGLYDRLRTEPDDNATLAGRDTP